MKITLLADNQKSLIIAQDIKKNTNAEIISFDSTKYILPKGNLCLNKKVKTETKNLLNEAIKNCDIIILLTHSKIAKLAISVCQELKKPYCASFLEDAQAISSFKLKHYLKTFYNLTHFIICQTEQTQNTLTKQKYKAVKYIINDNFSNKKEVLEMFENIINYYNELYSYKK